jgi:hypothetical protein
MATPRLIAVPANYSDERTAAFVLAEARRLFAYLWGVSLKHHQSAFCGTDQLLGSPSQQN